MTALPPRASAARERTARDLRTAAVAACVLVLSGVAWVWMSRNAVERRERVLSSVPAFPARGQEQQSRRPPAGDSGRPVPPRRVDLPPPGGPVRAAKADPMTSFVLQPAHDVALVHVNALLNTPLFDRIRQCMPAEWGKMTEETAQLGIDLERDLDRVAVTADGMAMSGFFDGKPIARNIARDWPDLEEREYRGQPIWLSRHGGIAQIGNLVVMGPRGSMDKLLDRALDPAPEGADPQDVYGDLFMRSDLSNLRGRGEGANPDVMGAILEGLSGVTVRANVWDMVALSVEGKPQPGRSVNDLSGMARGAIALAREQLDPSNVELATLAELAKVSGSGDSLNVELALPMNDIFDKLHFPCPAPEQGSASRDPSSRLSPSGP
jgi:hypothetical protein